MKDHFVIYDDELVQCKNDIVTHYSIKGLNSFSYEENKILGITYGDFKVGCNGKEVVIQRAYKEASREELKEKFDQLKEVATTKNRFVLACDMTYVNMNKLHKVKKSYEDKDTYYSIIFSDGQTIDAYNISRELRESLNRGKKPPQSGTSNQEEIEK